MNKKAKNPLYVIKNNGVDVESAQNFFELLLKKFNLEPTLNFINTVIMPTLQDYFQKLTVELFSKVDSYPMLIEVKKIYDFFLEKVITLIFEIQQTYFSKTKNA